MKIHSTFYYLVVISLLVLITGFPVPARASHIIGGEITFHSDTIGTSPFSYFFKLVVYSDNRSTADLEFASLDFGDNTSKMVSRSMKVTTADPYISRSVYQFQHNYTGSGTFIVSFVDVNRSLGYLNIPNSGSVAFAIQATVKIGIPATHNRSPVFQAFFISEAPINNLYQVNHHAYDADGDSLAYRLITNLQDVSTPITNYQFPDNLTINSRSGEITWNQPTMLGRYALALEVTEYRQGQVIGKVMRDFPITTIQGAQINFDLAIQNRNEFAINAQNQIFTVPLMPVTIKVLATNAAAIEVFSELLVLSKNVSRQVFTTGTSILYEFTIAPEETLRRSLPYLITFRGTSADKTVQKDLTVTFYLRPQRAGDSDNTDVLGLEPGNETDPWMFKVYPNPVVEKYFMIDTKQSTPATLQLYTTKGQMVRNEPLKLKQNKILQNNLGAGLYIYIIQNENKQVQQVGKLVLY